MLCLLADTTPLAQSPPDAAGPEALFKTKCSGCHTFGKGDHIGPDLKGVTDRRPRPWLIAWIRSSERMIRAGDPIGTTLFRQFKQQRMPDHNLSDAEIGALIRLSRANGPEANERQGVRRAHQATAGELELGEQLFFGRTALSGGGPACAGCHTVAAATAFGGTLGPDLSAVFPKYHDTALDQLLMRVSRPRTPALHTTSVTEQESLALRAFLRSVSIRPDQPTGEPK
jgi:mono/diheme cytochrome c family protein